MSETDLPAREAMEFDVVIVGAGPAGLSAAIRLKQLNPELGVVVVEKGSEVGAHILSGAVIDPVGLDRLLPEWRSEDTPIKTPVTDDRFYWLGPAGGLRAAELPAAAADVEPRQLHRVARQCVPLARHQGGRARRRDLSGLRGGRGALRRERRSRRRRDRRHGRRQRTASTRTRSRAAWSCAPSTRCSPRARAARSPSRSSPKFDLAKDREPQKFGIGLKELWKVAPEKHQPGLVQHTFGWPLDNRTGGGSFLYHLEDRQVVGRLRGAPELSQSLRRAVRGIPALQAASADPADLRGRQAHFLRRARDHRGRLAVGAEAHVPGRRADRLRGGLHQRAAHQGLAQRDPVRHAGGRACRGRARRGARRRRTHRLRRVRGAPPTSAAT